ncbi:MAG: hypothetical protein IJR93_13890 [Treponema sp.]|nr:hypothetical protein [Treponema sp.]
MPQKLLKAAAFTAVFLFLFVHLSYCKRGNLSYTRKNISGYYALRRNSLDVVFIGTSGTFSSFIPMQAWKDCGFASYNFCVNMMGANTIPYAVTEAMKSQKPKVLVIDIYPFITGEMIGNIGDSYTRYNTDGFKYSLNRFLLIKNEVMRAQDLTESPLSYFADIIKWHANDLTPGNFFCCMPNVDRGYNAMIWGKVSRPGKTDEAKTLSPDLEACLTKLLDKCARLDCQVLFVFYPFADTYKYPDALANVNYIGNKVREAGFAFRNFCAEWDEFGLDVDRDYWDPAHFNIYGAEKVTARIAPRLSEAYSLPDHRGERAYRDWDADYETWKNNEAEYKADIEGRIRNGL